MTREHYFPRWLIERASVLSEGIAWAGREAVPALSATVPLCQTCNTDFGRELEAPMSRIFDDIESGRGLSDREAELCVRWMWKFEGLGWILHHSRHIYTQRYRLRDRVLQPIDDIRGNLTLAISLAEKRDPDFEDGSLGIDSFNSHNAIFVAGTFSRVAIAVLLSVFDNELPSVFSKYRLSANRETADAEAKLFFPGTGFPTCTDAVAMFKALSPRLSRLHDNLNSHLRRSLQY
jgi:hypothetical protein